MEKKDHSTKAKILSAAKNVFIEQGFAGASMGKIAKLAGVNHSLIFHHFANKENLWLAVKLDIVNSAQEDLRNIPDTNLAFKDFLRAMITKNILFYKNHPELIRLLNWQRLESQKHHNIGITSSERMNNWIKAIKHYQAKKEVSPQHKPEFIVIFLFSVISSAALDPNIFIQDEADKNNYIEFCITCFERAFQ